MAAVVEARCHERRASSLSIIQVEGLTFWNAYPVCALHSGMEAAMPFVLLAMYWWKAALTPREPSVIVLLPEEDAPELAVTTSTPASYQG